MSFFSCPLITPLFYLWSPKVKGTPLMCHCFGKLFKNHKNEILDGAFFSAAFFLLDWLFKGMVCSHELPSPSALVSTLSYLQRTATVFHIYTELGVVFTSPVQVWLQRILFCVLGAAVKVDNLCTLSHVYIRIEWPTSQFEQSTEEMQRALVWFGFRCYSQ